MGEGTVKLGVRLLLRPRGDADFGYVAVGIDAFAEFEIGRVGLNEIFRRIRPIFVLIAEDFVEPRGLNDAN